MFNSLCLCVRFNMIKSKLVDLIRALVIILRPDRAEDSKYRQNFLTFGVGLHMCRPRVCYQPPDCIPVDPLYLG